VSKYADRIRGRGVINCFTGTAEDLKAYLDLGFYIAITGFLCNDARGVELRDVVKHIPLDKLARIPNIISNLLIIYSLFIPFSLFLLSCVLGYLQLIGSDAPHLIPFTMPKPYPRENEPAYLPHVLVTLAECLGLSLDEVARATTANARAVFGLPALPYDGSLRTPLPELLRFATKHYIN
jgi:TatD DNase family protein